MGTAMEDRMHAATEPYLPALGNHRITRHYDLVARLGMREGTIKRRVLARTRLAPDGRLLDIGCGTGTLALMAWRRYPQATIAGLDGDPAILAMARRKAGRARAPITFDEGMSYALPYADASFDAVTATLMLHHLTPDQQERTLAEVWRVLRPGGRFVVADFAPPHSRLMSLAAKAVRRVTRLHGGAGGAYARHRTLRVAEMLTERGWQVGRSPARFITLAGAVAVVSAIRPTRTHTAGTPVATATRHGHRSSHG